MAQLRVNTELRKDTIQYEPFTIPPDVYSTTPNYVTACDQNGNLSIFYDWLISTGQPEIINIYRDPNTSEWVEEATNFTADAASSLPVATSQRRTIPARNALTGPPTSLASKLAPRARRDAMPEPSPLPSNTGTQLASLTEGALGLQVFKHPITGVLHVGYCWGLSNSISSIYQVFVAYLDTGVKYPHWVVQQMQDPTTPDQPLTPLSFCFGIDSSGRLFVTCCVWRIVTNSGYMGALKWYPGTPNPQTCVRVPELDPSFFTDAGKDAQFIPLLDIVYGSYQDRAVHPNLSAARGYHVHTVWTVDNLISVQKLYRCTEGAPSAVAVTTKQYQSGWNGRLSDQVIFMKDPNAAPLLFGQYVDVGESSVFFICNSVYDTKPVTPNVRYLFKDDHMPPDYKGYRQPLMVEAVIRAPDDSPDGDTPATGQLDSFQVDVLCLFWVTNPKDTTWSTELWHTSSKPGGLVETDDGIYDISEAEWNPPSLITKNILPGVNPITSPTSFLPKFSLTLVGDTPVCTVLTADFKWDTFSLERESGNWIEEMVENDNTPTATSKSATGKMSPISATQVDIFYVDITAVLADGTVQSNLQAQIGSDSRLRIEVNGKNVWVDPDNPYETQMKSSGKLGVTIPSNGTLVPPSFWVWVEGMEEDAKVDIQASPRDMHEKFGSMTKDELLKATYDDGTGKQVPLITDDTIRSDPHNVLDHAAAGLQAISSVITGDTSASAEDSQYVYHKTSLNVARARVGGARRLGKLQGRQNIAFHMNFKDGFTCRMLTTKEIADHRASANNLFDWVDDVGDFFQDAAEGIYQIVDAVIDATGDVIVAAINFTMDQINHAIQFVVDTASQIADLAVQVFDAIKVAFEKLVAWLAFMFKWADFKATAKAFESALKIAGDNLKVFVTKALPVASDKAFEALEGSVGNFFRDAEKVFGTETVGSFNEPVILTSPEDAGVMQQLPFPELDFQDIIDGLEAGASWLLQKIMDLLFPEDSSISDTGAKEFTDTISDILDKLSQGKISQDAQTAINKLGDFLATFLTGSAFKAGTVVALLEALRALVVVGLDATQQLINGALTLFSFAADKFLSALTEEIYVPGISWIFETIMDEDMTVSSVVCLALAIPYTLIYKAITGRAPYAAAAADDEDSDEHLSLGILSLIITQVLGLLDILDDLAYQAPIVILRAIAVGLSEASILPDVPAGRTVAELDTGSQVDILAHSVNYIGLGTMVVRQVYGQLVKYRDRYYGNFPEGREPLTQDGAQKVMLGIEGGCSAALLVVALALIPEIQDQKDRLTSVSTVLSTASGCSKLVFAFVNKRDLGPYTRAGIIIYNWALGTTSASLMIASSQQQLAMRLKKQALLLESSGAVASDGQVRTLDANEAPKSTGQAKLVEVK